jgi:glycosyltransferase involved in cell wall biosynthesis
MMRVLYVIDHLGGGGAENQFVELVKRTSASSGVEAGCFLPVEGGIRLEGLRSAGVDVEVCEKPAGGRDTRRAVMRLRTILREFRPDVLHPFLMYSTFLAGLAAWGGSRPPAFVATEFSSPEKILEEVRFTAPKRMLLKWAYGRLDRLVTTSNGVRDELVDTGYLSRANTHVINEGVDLSTCAPGDRAALRRETGLPEDKRIVTIVGALVERKGHMFLLDAFDEVLKEFDDLVLYIVGEGEFRPEVESRARDLGITDRVVFTGYRSDAKKIIAASDVFCLPSLYEGMPNVVMESMALGTPVITTGRYGALDLIEHGESGMLIEPGDAGGIARSLRELLSDAALYDKVIRNALKKIQGFDFSVTAKKYIELYRELTG